MLPEELKEYYGTWAKMSRELDVGSNAYQRWLKMGYIPFKTQCLIENKTKRRFKASEKHTK